MKAPAWPRLLLFGVFGLLGAGLFPAAAAEAGTNGPLRKGDALLIRIEGIGRGLPAYREIVDSDGNIKLPFLHLLTAAGQEIPALEAEMAAAYAASGLATNAAVEVTFITHFEPPPDRANLVRIENPRQPVPAANGLPPPRTP